MVNKIIWSNSAILELDDVRNYWNNKNKSDLYSKKIQANIELAINLISLNPQIGISTNVNNVRMRLLLKRYYLVYEVKDAELHIYQFWDNKRNPIKAKYLRK